MTFVNMQMQTVDVAYLFSCNTNFLDMSGVEWLYFPSSYTKKKLCTQSDFGGVCYIQTTLKEVSTDW
jgi:hypothetical protein